MRAAPPPNAPVPPPLGEAEPEHIQPQRQQRTRPRPAWLRGILTSPAVAANTLPSIVVIEDDGDIARGLAFALSNAYTVQIADRGGSALELLAHAEPDLLLVDFRLPDTNGIVLMTELRERGTKSPAIMISAYEDQRAPSLAAGFEHFILKPWKSGELVWHIEHALARTD